MASLLSSLENLPTDMQKREELTLPPHSRWYYSNSPASDQYFGVKRSTNWFGVFHLEFSLLTVM